MRVVWRARLNPGPFKEGAKAATPIILGFVPVGMAFGVLAQKAGMTPWEAGLMSLLVYAGSSQFIAVEMLSGGSGWLPITLTTFFVNLRHLLMGSRLSLHFKRSSLGILSLLSAQLTDESFALAMADTSKIEDRPHYLLGLQVASQLAWVTATIGGALFGSLIDRNGYGLPFALPGLFICLLVLQIRSPTHVGMMILSGALALFFRWAFAGNWYIVLTAVVTSVTAVAIEGVRRKRKGQALEGLEP